VVEAYAVELLDLYRAAHRQMRAALDGLDAEALNWAPGPEMNSIAVLVMHVTGAESDTFLGLRQLPTARDRAVEFRTRVEGPAELLARIDAADALLEESARVLTDADLNEQRSRSGRPFQPGRSWLLGFFGHLREHLAHIEITRQLIQRR
jgi:hypothetical protein